jgi:hypothetical protein
VSVTCQLTGWASLASTMNHRLHHPGRLLWWASPQHPQHPALHLCAPALQRLVVCVLPAPCSSCWVPLPWMEAFQGGWLLPRASAGRVRQPRAEWRRDGPRSQRMGWLGWGSWPGGVPWAAMTWGLDAEHAQSTHGVRRCTHTRFRMRFMQERWFGGPERGRAGSKQCGCKRYQLQL